MKLPSFSSSELGEQVAPAGAGIPAVSASVPFATGAVGSGAAPGVPGSIAPGVAGVAGDMWRSPPGQSNLQPDQPHTWSSPQEMPHGSSPGQALPMGQGSAAGAPASGSKLHPKASAAWRSRSFSRYQSYSISQEPDEDARFQGAEDLGPEDGEVDGAMASGRGTRGSVLQHTAGI